MVSTYLGPLNWLAGTSESANWLNLEVRRHNETLLPQRNPKEAKQDSVLSS